MAFKKNTPKRHLSWEELETPVPKRARHVHEYEYVDVDADLTDYVDDTSVTVCVTSAVSCASFLWSDVKDKDITVALYKRDVTRVTKLLHTETGVGDTIGRDDRDLFSDSTVLYADKIRTSLEVDLGSVQANLSTATKEAMTATAIATDFDIVVLSLLSTLMHEKRYGCKPNSHQQCAYWTFLKTKRVAAKAGTAAQNAAAADAAVAKALDGVF
jgi:hypothetical protein